MTSLALNERHPSPLRYPGGKGKVANYLKLVMLENRLVGGDYVEPYAGGASVALSLLFENYAAHVHVNDLNRSVHAFWFSALNHTDELCDRIESARVSVDEWEVQRAVQADESADHLALGYSTFFLNRTSRSGIIGGGIIGGRDQTGAWKIDARWRPKDLVRRIRRIARYRTRITLTRLDAADLLSEGDQLGDAFIYLDPPYYVKGAGLYQNSYEHDDHAAIAKLVGQLPNPWVVSYDANPEIERLYTAFDGLDYDLRYSAQDRYDGSEVMFFSRNLTQPGVKSPANVPLAIVNEARLAAASVD